MNESFWTHLKDLNLRDGKIPSTRHVYAFYLIQPQNLCFFLLCWSSCSESDMRAVVIQQSLFSSALKPTPHYPVHRIRSFWTHSNQLPIRHFPIAVSLILEQETLLTDILTISQNTAKQMFGLSFQASVCSFCAIFLKPFSVFNSLMPLTEMMPWAEAFFLF